MKLDTSGQAAIVDAIMFMTIMLIASAVVIGATGFNRTTVQDSSTLQQYARDFSTTVLKTELSGLAYDGPNGETVNLGNSSRSISQLLCDEAMILGNGPSDYDFTEYNGETLRACNLIIRPGLGFAISCNGDSIFISDGPSCMEELPPTRSASQFEISPDSINDVIIIIFVWVV